MLENRVVNKMDLKKDCKRKSSSQTARSENAHTKKKNLQRFFYEKNGLSTMNKKRFRYHYQNSTLKNPNGYLDVKLQFYREKKNRNIFFRVCVNRKKIVFFFLFLKLKCIELMRNWQKFNGIVWKE